MISRRALLGGAAGLIASPAFADFPVITGSPRRLDQMLRRSGVWSNCALALDAGDARSYTTGQTWSDLTPNGRNFFRGASSTATTDDPTFNGTAGALTGNEYWTFDGGDDFAKATANDAYFDGLHKDNVKFSVAVLFYTPSSLSATRNFLSTFDTAGVSHGVQFQLNAANLVFVQGNNASTVTIKTSTATYGTSAWSFAGLSEDEAGGATGSFMQVNGTVETFNGAYTSPSSSAASLARIGSRFGNASFFASGTRLALYALFDTNITQTQMSDLRNYMMRRVA